MNRRHHAIRRKIEGEKHLKLQLFKGWKKIGLKDDFEDVYKIWKDESKCFLCDIKLTNTRGANMKTMDHCHETGFFRGILCLTCNFQEHNDKYWKSNKFDK